ncbi:MAG TPA: hypothetical protein VIC35_08840 [Acidimicrobiia bacterium]|jgi:hypothetical protein
MSHLSVAADGGTSHTPRRLSQAAKPSDEVITDRRTNSLGSDSTASPERLVVHNVERARQQLSEARENLKSARRRVVQLEDAVRNWEELATALLRPRSKR